MKRVAFLSFDWDHEVMDAHYEGMREWLSCHEGVQLVIFDAFAQQTGYGPEEGSLDIFELCDLDAYDGFVVQGNRAWPPEMRQQLVWRMRKLGKPVVTINYALEGAVCVGTDNFEAEFGLVSKVLQERGCTRPAFVNGLISSWEAKDRTQGYWAACSELRVSSPRFYQASWERESGVETALKMLAAPDELPDVVFCCNDDLAAGVQETLQAHGARVPEDVLVTGFDHRDMGLKADPPITTVDRDYRAISQKALDVMAALMDGEDVDDFVPSDARYVLTPSAGYANGGESDERAAQELHATDSVLRHFFEVLAKFQPAVLGCDSIQGIIRECERYFGELQCPNVYLTVNEDYLASGAVLTATPYGDFSLLVAHRGDGFEASCDERHVYARFASKEILPPQAVMNNPLYMVYPLRQGTACIGTLVTENASPILGHGFLTIVLTLLSSSIEGALRREVLQEVNTRLDDLYVHDQLTGLFNRFGLERYGTIAYEHLLRDFDEAQFIFVDVDGMKGINDEHGHDVGDQAIRDTAHIIEGAIEGENAFAMRYGGDEFLLISRRNLIPKIQRELDRFRHAEARAYDLSLSMGVHQALASDGLPIKEAIELADAQMYAAKQARGTGRA